ncbi:MAG: sugar phosphate isomerase/epimerase [archaeon]|jgi:sugar phosphate isomerase/epimerase|nr:sugar phosphate isomerase/epimerase [archaeon]
MSSFVGLSSSYFATRGFGIYDSVARAKELGFGLVELGAAHSLEKDVWKTVGRIKKDFSDLDFTVHGVFPPREKRFWFNPSLGLTPENRKLVGDMFKVASEVNALTVGIHSGFDCDAGFSETKHGFSFPTILKKLDRSKAVAGLKEVLDYALGLSKEFGIKLVIENTPGREVSSLLRTAEQFREIFEEFPELGFLLDFGHALLEKNLEELLSLHERIGEMHLHYCSPSEKNVADSLFDHRPFPGGFDFSQLKKIKQIGRIPLVFEHAADVAEAEILSERGQVEKFLAPL